MRFSKSIWFAILLPIFFIGSKSNSIGKENIKPYLESLYIVDACADANKKQVLITLNIGEVTRQDSLFGFNFEIKYDPSKIRFDFVLWQNTLADEFEIKHSRIDSKDSIIYGTFGHLNPSLAPVAGNKPLLAVIGYWLGNCTDSSEISISYLEYTEEFQKVNDGFENCFVYAKVKDEPNRLLEYSFDIKEIEFVSDSSIDVKLKINSNGNKLSKAVFALFSDEKFFKVDSVESIHQLFEITPSMVVGGGKGVIGKSFIATANNVTFDDEVISFRIKNSYEYGEYFGNVYVENYSVGNCDCITRYKSDTIKLYSNRQKEPDDTTSVIDYFDNYAKVYFVENSKEFVIERDEPSRIEIEIYDIQGKIVFRTEEESQFIRINVNYFQNGLYSIRLSENNRFKKVKNLIKY